MAWGSKYKKNYIWVQALWGGGARLIFSKILMEARKTLNTKVVQNFKSYNFCFKHFFYLNLCFTVRNLNSSEMILYILFFKFFSKFCVATWKTLQLWFWAKVHLSNICAKVHLSNSEIQNSITENGLIGLKIKLQTITQMNFCPKLKL